MIALSPADLHILLVEPSSTQRNIIVKELKLEGITHIDLAQNKHQALDKIEQSAPDLVISSLHFSDGSAVNLLNSIKESDSIDDVPFMLISSETRKSELEKFKQSGIIAILPKPFTRENLGKAINATLDILSPEELELNFYDVHDIRVLIVDDSRLARNHIRRVLTNLGIQHFSEAEDGQKAISILDEQMFDLIVTDYNMPEVNGQELAEYIRSESQQSHVPILMVSSEANDTHLANIAQSGVNAMCDKPFEPQTVKKLIYQLLDNH
ncbi:response regulator [Pseudoalteromonas denitrificans]|uniref:Two-component system, chemotaxis family, response regulator CheY n=1 Tax=Pseudoalteromonas denitrificans DSM 6059 TaxID=1123010 RepID=A0A1I1MJG0_9GAMM|nr:response regulator [Pseudoalteromonas denitrificans]SFC85654.1 two-component system, chemotaxis family, response regulator CheY [Pseudoalteromonas denitrificans DSM 6059]